jgi:hypothetical protein
VDDGALERCRVEEGLSTGERKDLWHLSIRRRLACDRVSPERLYIVGI